MHLRCWLLAAFLSVPVFAQDPAGGMQPFDACGVLVEGTGCALIEAGGGVYVVPNPGDFAFGETVRVVGTLDPDCTTICDADGCIRGAVVYDPALLPCGTPILGPADLVGGLCTEASGAIVALAAGGLWLARPKRQDPAVSRGEPPCSVSQSDPGICEW